MLKDIECKAALKSTKPVVILNDGSAGRGTGRLKLVVRNNRGTWFGSWFDQGKERKKKLGNYPDMSLLEARDKFATSVRAVLHDGKNPKAMADRTDKPTVQALFQGYIQSMKDANRSSWAEVERALLTGANNAADALGRDKMACDVDASDISAYLAKTFKRGARVAADRYRSYVSAAFNWGIKSEHDYTVEDRKDWGIKVNPVSMVKKDENACQPRERNLSEAELRAIWHAADGDGFSLEVGAAIKLLIATGQRIRELLRVEGSEIDLENKLWKMPAQKTKTKQAPHVFPIPDASIPIFEKLIAVHGTGYLFPARFGKKELIADTSLNKAIGRWCKINEAAHFQTRDLRRTWKSRTGDIGIDRFTRDLIQQHAKGDTGSIHYDKANYLPQMREAMKTWNDWLVKAL